MADVADNPGTDLASDTIRVNGLTAGLLTIAVAGDVDGTVADALTTRLAEAMNPEASVLVLDLTEVTSFSLEGVSLLLTLTHRCAREHRDLRVIASAAVRGKVRLVGLETFIPLRHP